MYQQQNVTNQTVTNRNGNVNRAGTNINQPENGKNECPVEQNVPNNNAEVNNKIRQQKWKREYREGSDHNR